jgi:hypothetical protein
MLKIIAAVAGCAVALGARAQTPQSTSFTYQGLLKLNGQALSQAADFQFRLYDAPTAGNQIGAQLSVPGQPVNGGLFSTLLDFGTSSYADGNGRWLEIDVRSPAGSGVFSTLPVRQALTSAPYANNTRGIAVDVNGSVGIGTNNPSNRMNVVGLGDNNCIVAIDSGSTATQSSTLRLNDRGSALWSLNKNTSNDFTIREAGLGLDRLYIAQGGNVGIGTSSPANRLSVNGDANVGGNLGIGTSNPASSLEIRGGAWNLTNGGGASRAYCEVVSTVNGSPADLQMLNGSNQFISYLGFQGTANTRPLIGVLNPADNTVIRAGAMWNGGSGVIFGDLKQFRVVNPRQPGTDIAYTCVEGPEAAAYVRGTGHLVNGKAVVVLPQHFQDVTVTDGMTVQVTPGWAGSRGLAVTLKASDHFEVEELLEGAGTYDFDWRVEAVRAGHENYQVIVPTAERAPGGSLPGK